MLVLAGCSTTVPGSAVLTTMPAPATEVDLHLLDPGNYPTKPRATLGTASDTGRGALLEAARLADYVVGPWRLDPVLIHDVKAGVGPSTFDEIFGTPATEAAQRHALLAVFTTARVSTAPKSNAVELNTKLTNAVLRFPSPADAQAAAAELVSITATHNPYGTASYHPNPIQIPRHPTTSALAQFWDDIDYWQVEAFTVHGPYVLAQYTKSKGGADAATERIAATLDLQEPLIDQFTPTPVDKLSELPLDPDGLLAHTLPPAGDDGLAVGPVAQLHFDNDPIRSQALFHDAHLDQVSHGRTQVYRTADAAAAKKIVDAFASKVGMGFEAMVYAPGIKGMPGSKCLMREGVLSTDQIHYCVAAADRYVVEVSATQELEAHQVVSAQYLMLTAK